MLLFMAPKKYHLSLYAPQQKLLERLAVKWGLDITNTMRHCIARIAEQEGITASDGKLTAPARRAPK
jgi:hypothetical protein